MDKAKALGNALANKLRGFEDHTNQMENPQNMPAQSGDPTSPPEEGVTVPVATMPDAMEGDTYTVTAVDGQNVTLIKEAPPTPEAPPIS